MITTLVLSGDVALDEARTAFDRILELSPEFESIVNSRKHGKSRKRNVSVEEAIERSSLRKKKASPRSRRSA